ncbi:O-glycoside alpha-1,2-mannosyltransferase [Dirofilaria immitis]
MKIDISKGGCRFRNRCMNNILSPNSKSRHGHEIKRHPLLRIKYEYRYLGEENKAVSCEICGRPYFELQRDDTVYTAQAFAATRFGSTKLKSHQGVDAGNGYHPYTTPSLYAYLQLLIFLNALACLTVWSEKLEQELDNIKNEVYVRQRENDFNISLGKGLQKLNGDDMNNREQQNENNFSE